MSKISLDGGCDAFDPQALGEDTLSYDSGVIASHPPRNLIEEGLDFILDHFSTQNQLFPRTISTKTTEGSQILVYSREEALARFKAVNYKDCKISAYPKYVEWQGINRQAPDLLFMDLDMDKCRSKQELDLTLKKTLQNIQNILGPNVMPTVLWSGHGDHIYLPVDAFVLEETSRFAKFDQPSRGLLRFAEYYLTNKKADSCHNSTMSLKNCMLRVPGSFNAKEEGQIEEVKIIQKWNGYRPSITPLLFDLYINLQNIKLKRLRRERQGFSNHYHPQGEFCKYWKRNAK